MRRPGLEDRCRIRPGLAGYRPSSSALTLPTTNLTLRLDPTVEKTVVDDSGGGGHSQAVSAWGANATQGTLANRGAVATNATLGESVRLDPSGTPEFFDLVPGLSGGEYSIYAAIDITDEGLMDVLLGWGAGPDFLVAPRQYASTNFGVYDGSAYYAAHAGVDGAQLLRVLVSEANNRIAVYRDGALAAESTSWTGTVSGAAGQGRLGIDGAEQAIVALSGDVRALYIYSAYHSTGESAAVEAYMIQETPGLAP